MDILFVEQLLKKGEISNELELERASMADRRLRKASKTSLSIASLRKELRKLIMTYEDLYWSKDSTVTKERLEQSDQAEIIAEQERIFLNKRKNRIKIELKRIGLKQQQLGQILGHQSKTYTSELMSGVKPFTLKDLMIISSLLEIKLGEILPNIPIEDKMRVRKSIDSIKQKNSKLNSWSPSIEVEMCSCLS